MPREWPQFSQESRQELASNTDQGLHHPQDRNQLALTVEEARCKFGADLSRRLQQALARMSAQRGEHAVMAGERFSHARFVEDPATERRPIRRLDVGMHEGRGSDGALLGQEPLQTAITKMMNDPGRSEDARFGVEAKCVGHDEAARKSLFVGEGLSLAHESCIVVATHQLDFITKATVRPEPAHDEAEPTAREPSKT